MRQNKQVTAIKVHQWLNEWNKVQYDEKERKRQPPHHFYLLTLSANELKALSGVYRRTTENAQLRSQDLGIQRRHDPERSEEINRFIQYGYPWSSLSPAKRESGQFDDLRKPGWLPTAIIVNILLPQDERRGKRVNDEDLIEVNDLCDQTAIIELPKNFIDAKWRPTSLPPIEVIDGQHRLWAFEDDHCDGDYELPIVAFWGLDISWQAYLFWTINIKPKRINPSLAYDLYPLLRTEDWLERFEGSIVYRETRAQELVEALWAYPQSPWYQRINMLGESGKGQMVTQAAWVKSLTVTYVKSWEGKGIKGIGGLFGSKTGSDEVVLPWSRTQQAAFLIFIWQQIEKAVTNCDEEWAEALRAKISRSSNDQDPAFSGSYDTHFNTNIGTRGVLYITNDLCYVLVDQLELQTWIDDEASSLSDSEAIRNNLEHLSAQKVANFINEIAASLVTYDWRTTSAPGLSEDERQRKGAIRGGAGYKEIRKQLLKHLTKSDAVHVSRAASQVIDILGYE